MPNPGLNGAAIGGDATAEVCIRNAATKFCHHGEPVFSKKSEITKRARRPITTEMTYINIGAPPLRKESELPRAIQPNLPQTFFSL